MPKLALELRAELTNVRSLTAPANYPWHLTIKCTSCGETTAKPIVISADDVVEGIRGGDVTARLKCKLCARVNDVVLLPGEHVYGADGGDGGADGGDEDADGVDGAAAEGGVGAAPRRPGWARFALLDCRGIEPVAWVVADDVPMEVVAGGGAVVDGGCVIEGGEWYGYDEGVGGAAGGEVAVTELEYRFVKVK